jgi:hypothetical protein
MAGADALLIRSTFVNLSVAAYTDGTTIDNFLIGATQLAARQAAFPSQARNDGPSNVVGGSHTTRQDFTGVVTRSLSRHVTR